MLTAPAAGWTASFIELTFDVGATAPLKLTTDITDTPHTLPFPSPTPEKPKGFLRKSPLHPSVPWADQGHGQNHPLLTSRSTVCSSP